LQKNEVFARPWQVVIPAKAGFHANPSTRNVIFVIVMKWVEAILKTIAEVVKHCETRLLPAHQRPG
jgi:hypothetical protein